MPTGRCAAISPKTCTLPHSVRRPAVLQWGNGSSCSAAISWTAIRQIRSLIRREGGSKARRGIGRIGVAYEPLVRAGHLAPILGPRTRVKRLSAEKSEGFDDRIFGASVSLLVNLRAGARRWPRAADWAPRA